MSRKEESSRGPTNIRALLITGACSGLGAAASAFLYLRPASNADDLPSAWYGVIAVALIALGSFCLLTATASLLARPSRGKNTQNEVFNPDREYIARYTTSIRLSAMIMVVLFAALTLLIIFNVGEWRLVAVSLGGLTALVFYSNHVLGTSVRFTNTGFVARAPFCSELRADYENVRGIMSRPGILRVEFAHGRILNIRAGLGDPDVIISLLDAHCPETPESIQRNTSTG